MYSEAHPWSELGQITINQIRGGTAKHAKLHLSFDRNEGFDHHGVDVLPQRRHVHSHPRQPSSKNLKAPLTPHPPPNPPASSRRASGFFLSCTRTSFDRRWLRDVDGYRTSSLISAFCFTCRQVWAAAPCSPTCRHGGGGCGRPLRSCAAGEAVCFFSCNVGGSTIGGPMGWGEEHATRAVMRPFWRLALGKCGSYRRFTLLKLVGPA